MPCCLATLISFDGTALNHLLPHSQPRLVNPGYSIGQWLSLKKRVGETLFTQNTSASNSETNSPTPAHSLNSPCWRTRVACTLQELHLSPSRFQLTSKVHTTVRGEIKIF